MFLITRAIEPPALSPSGSSPGFEEIGDVLFAPFADTFLRDVRYPSLAFRIWPAGETLRGDDATEEIARAVTLGAMAEAVDEISAAIPVAGCVGSGVNGLSSMNSNFQMPMLRRTLNGNGMS